MAVFTCLSYAESVVRAGWILKIWGAAIAILEFEDKAIRWRSALAHGARSARSG